MLQAKKLDGVRFRYKVGYTMLKGWGVINMETGAWLSFNMKSQTPYTNTKEVCEMIARDHTSPETARYIAPLS